MLNLEIKIKGQELHLYYFPRDGAKYIFNAFQKGERVTVKGVFTFNNNELVKFDDYYETAVFRLGKKDGEYWTVSGAILKTDYPVKIHVNLEVKPEYFVGKYKTSIMSGIEGVINRQVVIGVEEDGLNIPYETFVNLLNNFPTERELQKYYKSKIYNLIKDATNVKKDAQKDLDSYINKRQTIHSRGISVDLKRYEVKKYQLIQQELKEMLSYQEKYSEQDWQKMIVEIFLLLNPKYVALLEKVRIPDAYKNTYRELDLMLIDTNGTVDIIEIKRAHYGELISKNPGTRGNFLPQKSLSEAIIQAEKYIFHLNKYGKRGEEELTEKYKNKLPPGLKIQIRNPKAIIVMGRSNDMEKNGQQLDFEIIKRHYSNVIDVISYDDLLQRLDRIINRFNLT